MRAPTLPNHRHPGVPLRLVLSPSAHEDGLMAITWWRLRPGALWPPRPVRGRRKLARQVTHARPVHAVALRAGAERRLAGIARAGAAGRRAGLLRVAPVHVARHGTTITVDLREGSIVPPWGTACISARPCEIRCASRWARLLGSYLVWPAAAPRACRCDPASRGLCQRLAYGTADRDRVALAPVVLIQDVHGHQPDRGSGRSSSRSRSPWRHAGAGGAVDEQRECGRRARR